MSLSTFTRRAWLALLALPLLLCTSVAAQAATFERELPLAQAWNTSSASGRWLAEVVADPAADRSLAPALTWYWLLEDGERIVAAELQATAERQLAALARSPRRVPLVSTEGRAVADRAGEPLWSSDYRLELGAPQRLHGRSIQSITLVPLRETAGTLRGLAAATLRLETAHADAGAAALKPLRADFPLRRRILSSLGDRLLNADALPAAGRAVGGSGFPTEVPGIEGAAVEMVMVTVDSFADLCQTYADAKTDQGVPTVVRSIEWIAQHYPAGSDRQEMVRTFVQDAYSKWSIRYLLIVGDAQHLPPRYAKTDIFGDDTTAPTDMYYGCLDGDWNADHDAFWAEAADTTTNDPGDVTDWLAEISVGRLPATDRADCQVLLDKSAAYRDAAGTDYQNRILMLGEVLFPTDWVPGDNIIQDGAEYCDSIYIKHTGPDQHVVRLYENYEDYPGSLPLNIQSALDSMANGFNIVVHNGHGQKQSMHVGDGSIDNNMVSTLDNADDNFLLYMVNCTAAAFDFNCIAEAFLSNPDGGAFAIVGSTRETFANISGLYMDRFFELVWTQHELTLGELYDAGLATFVGLTNDDNGHRWAHSTFTLLADPSNWLHYKLLEDFSLDMAATHPLDGSPFVITVSDQGLAPVPDVRLAVHKGDEDYHAEYSDAGGMIAFTPKAETAGRYQVRGDRRDFRPRNGSFDVELVASSPLLRVAAVTVDDTSDGTVVGNGNGLPERGETVRLQLSVINNGNLAATGVTGTLSLSSAHVSVLDGADGYADLGPGASDGGSDPYLVQILASAPDDAILHAELTLGCNEGSFAEDFFLEAGAPLLALDRAELDDATGNGDGHLDDGETATYSVLFSNWGRADAIGVQADIEPTAGSSLSVNVGSASLGTLTALTGGQGPAVFEVTRTGVATPELRLILSDGYGRADSLVFALERPLGVPGAPTYDFHSDPTKIVANWLPAPEEDAAGYVVHRADAPAGPYEVVSEDWVAHSTYEDGGLAPLTSYWYRVQPLSAAGLAGVASDSSKVTTPLPVLAGWPQRVGLESICTPVICDVNGDGLNEIFVGSDKVYGFKPDGSELGNGDNDPLTKGPISDAGYNFRSALAAADLTASPGLELVASSWDTGEVYVFEFSEGPGGIMASVAAGWPRAIANPNGYGIWAAVSLADVDGDDELEIFVADVGGYLNAWNADGSEVADGDDDPLTQGIFATGFGSWPRSTVAFADIDSDGDSEIFVTDAVGQLRGYQGDGTTLPGFPVGGMAAVYASPVIGDVDDDGRPEIVVAAENDSLYVYNDDGSRLPGWPLRFVNDNGSLKAPTPALADITGDGVPEIFACGVINAHEMLVGWLDMNANWLPEWPVDTGFHSQSSPVVGDLDGDGDFETVLSLEDGTIQAWHHDGAPVDGFPLSTSEFARSVPTLIDIDQNGNLDMAFLGWDKNLYVWEFPTAYYADGTPWYTFMHDFTRTGNRSTLDWVTNAEDDGPLPAGTVLRLDDNFPNPFNPKTTIRFAVGGETKQPVALDIFDVRGRRLTRLVQGDLAPGTYERSWDGRSASGAAMSSGIYFARLKVGTEVDTKKLTLLK